MLLGFHGIGRIWGDLDAHSGEGHQEAHCENIVARIEKAGTMRPIQGSGVATKQVGRNSVAEKRTVEQWAE